MPEVTPAIKASVGFASETGPRERNEDFAGAIFGITLAFVGLIFNFEMTGKSVSDWIGEDGASLLLPAAALLGGGVGLLMARRNAGR